MLRRFVRLSHEITAFTFDQQASIGEKSGEYGGRYSILAPTDSIAFSYFVPLCGFQIISITTCPGRRQGHKFLEHMSQRCLYRCFLQSSLMREPFKRKAPSIVIFFPFVARFRGMGTRALERTCILPGHGDIDPGFIDKDYIAGRERLDGLPVGACPLLLTLRLSFLSHERLFFVSVSALLMCDATDVLSRIWVSWANTHRVLNSVASACVSHKRHGGCHVCRRIRGGLLPPRGLGDNTGVTKTIDQTPDKTKLTLNVCKVANRTFAMEVASRILCRKSGSKLHGYLPIDIQD